MTEKGYYGVTRSSDYLAHHGVLGQKWGIRRFQNPDGTLTDAGKKRYGLDYSPTKLRSTFDRVYQKSREVATADEDFHTQSLLANDEEFKKAMAPIIADAVAVSQKWETRDNIKHWDEYADDLNRIMDRVTDIGRQMGLKRPDADDYSRFSYLFTVAGNEIDKHTGTPDIGEWMYI